MTKYQFAIQLKRRNTNKKAKPTTKTNTSNISQQNTNLDLLYDYNIPVDIPQMKIGDIRTTQVFNSIIFKKGSVLGYLSKTNLLDEDDEIDYNNTALVDAAGYDFMSKQKDLKNAGMSSRALYNNIPISVIPEQVYKTFIKGNLLATLTHYNISKTDVKHIIHAVGPNLNYIIQKHFTGNPFLNDNAESTRASILLVSYLCRVYLQIFKAFNGSTLNILRLIPISTGVFASNIKSLINDDTKFTKLMQELTMCSILTALILFYNNSIIHEKQKQKLYKSQIILCMYADTEKYYKDASAFALNWYNKNVLKLLGGALNFHSIKHKKRRKYSNINKAKLVKRTLRKRNTFSKYT